MTKKLKDFILKEASSDFKFKKILGKKSKLSMFWEYKLLPATVSLEFLFKIKFNKDKINKDYNNPDTMSPYEFGNGDKLFFNEIIKRNLSEFEVKLKSRKINNPGFYVTIVTYKGELNIKTLDINSNKPQEFGYSVTVEATDKKRIYTTKEIIDMASKFIKPFENLVLKNTKYYSIIY